MLVKLAAVPIADDVQSIRCSEILEHSLNQRLCVETFKGYFCNNTGDHPYPL
jgi:hypothetical protein